MTCGVITPATKPSRPSPTRSSSKTPSFYTDEGFVRSKVPSFNEDAVREAILNAVSHRDYREEGSIFVRQFPDKIEIVSPGGFPRGIDPGNLLWKQKPRNRRIAETFARCGLIERSGQGANRIFEASILEIRFFLNRAASRTPTFAMKTETGSMRVATAAATAFDLVRYVESVGYLGNVATVLHELAEKLDPQKLVEVAQETGIELSVVQRLGFLLAQLGMTERTEALALWLAQRRPRPVLLRPDRPAEGAAKDPRWQVLVNDDVEIDL